MTETTNENAMTLHRLLDIGKISDEKPNPDMSVTPIDGDVIIIDEMSMVDLFLMNYVLNGIYKGSKLILVGDIDQLESVGAGSVLKDLIQSNKIPYIVLNKIFRQAAKSKIIVNSHKVNEGVNFISEINIDNEDDEKIDDFHFIDENNLNEAKEILLENYNQNTQIITPTKKGELGTKVLNKLIQEKFNPKERARKEKKFGDVIFRVGDKVMQTKNNYDIEWQKENKETNLIEYNSGIFNGEMGIIKDIYDDENAILIKFEDNKEAIYTYEELDQIEHSFAITVHKSQGSEFDEVIMPILNVPQMLLTRNILYTGMTRAKKNLIIISNSSIINYMINNANSKKRNSGLKYKIENIFS